MGLDKIIHEHVRLIILTYLASSENQETSFNEMQTNLDLTSGNLSVQLKKLEAAGYIEIKKVFKENKPLTTAAITAQGKKALSEYIKQMEKIISVMKKNQ